MIREQRLMRLFRALSGENQEEAAHNLGVFRTLLTQIENGDVEPDPAFLEPMAESAGIEVTDGDLLLHLVDTMRRARQRWSAQSADPLDRTMAELRLQIEAACQRLLTLPLPESLPRPGDREGAEVLFRRLAAEPGEVRPAIVRAAEEYQSWAVCERACAASEEAASQDLDTAAAWVSLAREIANRVRGPEEFRSRLQGYVAAHAANLLRVSGELNEASIAFAEAELLWLAGADPYGVLDPGRLWELEASLRRAQRWPAQALDLLEKAWAVGHRREHVLVKKGFTLEVMGEYERAAETLREALPLAERAGDARLLYMAKGNLAVVYTHLGRYREAKGLLQGVRELAAERGDANEMPRVTWLEGRIAAGLGRRREALLLLEEARQEFERRKMTYDAALALLEEAVLLLEEGRAAEVKALAAELVRVFEANGVHREALAALRLFHEAAEGEKVTADLARRVLRFLFRAQHDQGARFEE
jgi:tetratricopeptide (TPR) repeat protein